MTINKFHITSYFVITLVINLATNTYSKTYYVSPQGSDANSGSEQRPWRTLQKAHDALVAGDTVLIKEGIYRGQLFIKTGGTAKSPITYKAYANHKVFLDGLNSSTIRIKNASYITIDGLHVYNGRSGGIWVENSNHVTVKNCTVDSIRHIGIRFISSHYGNIINNKITRTGRGGSVGEGIYLGQGGDGGHTSYCHDILVQGNRISDGLEGIDVKDDCYNITIEENEIFDLTGEGGITIHNVWNNHSYRNIVVRGNLIHDLSGNYPYGIRIYAGCEVYNNIIYSTESYGIELFGGFEPINVYTQKVYHNTIYDTDLDPIREHDDADTDIRNNIGPSYKWNLASSPELFIDAGNRDFHLVNGNSAIDAGVDVGIAVDYEGNTRPIGSAPDMGAYEFNNNADKIAPHPPKNVKVKLDP